MDMIEGKLDAYDEILHPFEPVRSAESTAILENYITESLIEISDS